MKIHELEKNLPIYNELKPIYTGFLTEARVHKCLISYIKKTKLDSLKNKIVKNST